MCIKVVYCSTFKLYIMLLKEIRRNGERVIKYKLNVDGTKHLFCYCVAGVYYQFIMYKGCLIDKNNILLTNHKIKRTKNKGIHFNSYLKSSLNEYYTESIYNNHKTLT